MHRFRLYELYNYMIEKLDVIEFMDSEELVELIPLSNIEYLDKIKGLFVGISLGNKRDFRMGIVLSESLIIYQDYNPIDIINRLSNQIEFKNPNDVKNLNINYSIDKISIFKNIDFIKNCTPIIIAPLSAINYGDFNSLKLMAGIQASIINGEDMMVGMNIVMSVAISHLMNTQPFSLKKQEDLLNFIDICSNSIKTIKNKNMTKLYNILDKNFKNAIKDNMDVDMAKEKWGNSINILDLLTYSLYIFLKNPKDCKILLKNCLIAREPDIVMSMTLGLVGAYLGLTNMPEIYIESVNNLDEIFIISERLFELSLKNTKNNPYRKRTQNSNPIVYEDEIDKLIWEGIQYSGEGEFEKSAKHFEELILKYPNIKRNEKIKSYIIEAYGNLGTSKLENEDYDEALKYFKMALSHDLNNPTILCDIAITYLNLDNLDKAEKYVRRSVEIFPQYQIGREVLDAIISLKK